MPRPAGVQAMVALDCQNPDCDKSFEVWKYRAEEAKFCSRECANSSPVRRGPRSGWKRPPLSLVCKGCARDFEVEHWRAGALYCSRKCKDSDHKREIRTCFCGVSFVVYPSEPKKFCSLQCAFAGRARSSEPELSLIPYLEPLGYVNTDSHPLYFTHGDRVRVPDFVNSKARKIIEVFGEYWHRDRILPEGKRHETPDECVEWYHQLGWECQVVWVEELEAFKGSLTESVEKV